MKSQRVYFKRIIEILELSTFEIGNVQINDSNDLKIDLEGIEE